ncbi:MAG: cadherin-like domain-containing protein, partial [Oscillospiraceae bacterium]|nr:cadherin-like domain-containing protein [Oscillospiraceae bacterium]
MKRKVCMLLSALLIGGCAVFPAAADVTTDGTAPEQGIYCFSREELAEKSNLEGVYLLSLPARSSAELRLGNRSLRSGDVIPRSELTRILVEPHAGGEAVVRYLPVESGKIGEETVLTFHLEQTEDKPPVAEAGELETWRNLPNSGTLRATNDDDGTLRFQLENHPRRGTVELNPDGSYTYTPKKNKVGEDSFTFTVTDEAGNVSAPATVRVTIRKPTDAQTFADLDRDAQFTALWLRETGLFGGE